MASKLKEQHSSLQDKNPDEQGTRSRPIEINVNEDDAENVKADTGIVVNNIRFTTADLVKIAKPDTWMNDNTIMFGLTSILERCPSHLRQQILLVDTQVTGMWKSALKTGDVSNASRILGMMQRKIASKEQLKLIVVPLHVSSCHWTLVAICLNKKPDIWACYCDSGVHEELIAMDHMKDALYLLSLPYEDVTSFVDVDVPQQTDGHSCGDHMLCFAEAIINDIACFGDFPKFDDTEKPKWKPSPSFREDLASALATKMVEKDCDLVEDPVVEKFYRKGAV
jgi:Ulp1 family protease